MGWFDAWSDTDEGSDTLTERREFVRGGRVVARGYLSPGGMLRAVEQRGQLQIQRRWGPSGGTLRCKPDELQLLEGALAWSDQAAANWARYEYGYYKDPISRLRLPGRRPLALPRGETWTQRPFLRAEKPQAVAPGVVKIGSLWHPAERIGPAVEQEVGAMVRVGSLVAWCSGPVAVLRSARTPAKARPPEAALHLSSPDIPFLAELRACAAANLADGAQQPRDARR